MLCKSSKWELGFVHYIEKFTILRFVISRFECIKLLCTMYCNTEQKQIYGHMTETAPIHSASNCIKNALNKCFSRLSRLSEVALKSARNLQKDTYFSFIPNLPPIYRFLGTDLESCADMHLKKMKVLLPLSLD